MTDFLRDLLSHAEWANAVFFHTWGKSPARDHEDLRRRMDHLIGVQHGFAQLLRGEPPGGPKDGPPSTYGELLAWAPRCHAQWNQLMGEVDEGALSRRIHIPWFGDPEFSVTARDAIVQVAMHSQHHRGQCMTRLRELGGEPKNVDWIIWLWKQKPAARWAV